MNLSRSLRDAGRDWRLVGTDCNRWHLPLSVCDETYWIPHSKRAGDYAAAIADVIAREHIDVVVPTHPVEVRAIAGLRDDGSLGRASAALPATRVVEIADDKAACCERMDAAGVPVPRTRLLAEPSDLAAAFEQLGAPVWVRGTGAPGLGIGGAALPCRQLAVATAWVEHHGGWGKMAASEFLPGRNLTWMGAFDTGALVAAGTRERLEYVLPHVSPSGVTGAPAVTRTIREPAIASVGESAVRSIDSSPHGVYFVDMKEDAGGDPRVTEINAGRCGTTVHFYTVAGFNFPAFLVDLAVGRAPQPLADPNAAIRPDLYWVRTLDCGPALIEGDGGFDGFPRSGEPR